MSRFNWYPESERRFAAEKPLFGDEAPVNRIDPLVSVCVATYQHGPYIRECLDGLLTQITTFPFEVIIGEDESTDGTRDICIEYATRHPDKIRLFLRSRERSVYREGSATRNLNALWCRQSARGKYIAFCEGDDCWTHPDKLRTQVDLLESMPDVALCGHRVIHGVERVSDDPEFHPKHQRPFLNGLDDILAANWIATCSTVVRRDVVPRELPEWVRKVPYGDWPLQVMAAQRGKIAFLDTVMGFYRVHTGGMWSGQSATVRAELALAFYRALKGAIPRDVWAKAVRPEILKLSTRLYRAYRLSGDNWRAMAMAWEGMRADPLTMAARAAGPLPNAIRRLRGTPNSATRPSGRL